MWLPLHKRQYMTATVLDYVLFREYPESLTNTARCNASIGFTGTISQTAGVRHA